MRAEYKATRAKGMFTVPSTVGRERRINFYARTGEPAMQKLTGTSDKISTMAKLREWRNQKFVPHL